jgi:hypothetical protein
VILLALLVLASQSFAGFCNQKNPFLGKLVKEGVRLHAEPRTYNGPLCGKEWTKHKTCCDPKTLMEHASRDTANIRRYVRNVGREIRGFRKFSNSVYLILHQIGALRHFNWEPLVTNNETRKRLAKFIKIVNKDLLLRNTYYVVATQRQLNQFRNANQFCWNKMASIRNSSLCSTCSGSSIHYFVNGKANVEEQVCKAVISDCWLSFRLMTRYLTQLADIGTLQHLETTYGSDIIRISNKDRISVRRAKEIMNRFDKSKIYFLLDGYNPSKIQQDDRERRINALITRTLCRRFVRLHGITVLEKLDHAIDGEGILASLGNLTQLLVDKHRQSFTNSSKYNALIHQRVRKSYRIVRKFESTENQKQLEELEKEERTKNLILEKLMKLKNAKLEALEWKGLDRKLNIKSKDSSLDSLAAKILPLKNTDNLAPLKQLLPSLTPLTLEADFNIMMDFDNLFSSTDGQKGSALAQEYTLIKPMNLSLVFP